MHNSAAAYAAALLFFAIAAVAVKKQRNHSCVQTQKRNDVVYHDVFLSEVLWQRKYCWMRANIWARQ